MPIPADLLPLTLVEGQIFGPDGLPHGGVITFTLTESFVAGDPPVLIVNDAIPVTADPTTGYFSVELLPGDDPDGIPFTYDVHIAVADDDPDLPTYQDFSVVIPASSSPVNLFALTPSAPIAALSAYARVAADETITGSWRFLGPVYGPDGLPFGTGSGSSGGTTDHQALTNRTSADAHPLTAITGLVTALAGKQTAGDYAAGGHSHAISSLAGVSSDFAAQYLNTARGDVRYVQVAARGAANGVATLGADGRLTAAQVPPFAVGEVFTVADQAAMLALAADPLDAARRTDTGTAWLLLASPATDINNWTEITSSAADATTSSKGVIRLAGDLAGTAASPTVPGLAAKADTSALAPVALSGNYADLIGSPPAATVTDATATAKGVVALAGDLSGDAANPTLAVDRVRTGNFVGRLWFWDTVSEAEAAVGAGDSQPGDLHIVKGA